MTDRKIRAIIAVAFVAGLFIASVSFLMYFRKWPTWVMVAIFVTYSIIQISMAPSHLSKNLRKPIGGLACQIKKALPSLGLPAFA